jgi:hypothetical protein
MDPNERKWTLVALALGTAYFLISAFVVAPMIGPAADELIGQLSGGSSASSISLIYPADGAVVAGTTSSLSWNCSIDASYYVLVISDDPELSDPYNVTTRQNSLVLSGLEMGTTYYWEVCPVADGSYGVWSETWSFTVGSSTGSPTPVTPYNNTIYIDEVPVLTWTAVSGASGYEVEISTDEDFTTILASVEVSGTNYTAIEMVTENTTYYWKVAAVTDDDGVGEWSQAMALFVSPTSYAVERTWTFYADGSTWTLSVNVSAEEYWEAKTLPRAVMSSMMEYANYVTNDDVVNEVARQLAAMAASKGYDAYTTACFVLSFVQNTYYDSDLNTTGEEEYPRYPVETLVDGTGDCEDTSVLFASLIQTSYFGMDAVLVGFYTPSSSMGHMAVGLYFDAADLPSEVSYTYNGTEYELALEDLISWNVQAYRFGQSYAYYYCECTSEMPIGWPTEIEEWYHAIIPC